MAFAKNISVVIDKMKQLNTPYYSVCELDGKTLLSENDDEISVEAAMDELDQILHNIEGSVKVILRPTSKKSRAAGGALNGSHIYSLRLGEEKQNKSINGMDNTIMGLMQQNYESKLDAIKKDYEFREEMRELKESLKSDNSTSSLNEIIEHLKPFLPMILNKLGMIGPVPSIAGQEDDIIEETIDAATVTKLNESVAELMQIDENFVDTIQILAKFAKQAPEQYKSFIPILKSQIK